NLMLSNVTPEREEFLMEFRSKYSGERLLAELRKRLAMPEQSETATMVRSDNPTNRIEQNPIQSTDQAYNRGNWNDGQLGAATQPAQQVGGERYSRGRASDTAKYTPKMGKEVDPGVNLDALTTAKPTACDVGDVLLSPMKPLWFPSPEQPDYLLYVRL